MPFICQSIAICNMDRLGKIKSHHLQPDSRMYLPQMLNCAAGVLASACCWHQGRTPPAVLRWMSLLYVFLPTCLPAALPACCARAPPLAAGCCVDRTWPGSWLLIGGEKGKGKNLTAGTFLPYKLKVGKMISLYGEKKKIEKSIW